MPQLGESIVEATLVAWRVRPGDRVERGQVLAEVETDKATNEIPAPRAGVVQAILTSEGTTVPVGTVVLRYEPKAEAAAPSPSATGRPAVSPKPSPPERGAPSGGRLAPRPTHAFAPPSVRRLARAESVELDRVAGTGPRGRITRQDVLSTGRASPVVREREIHPDAARATLAPGAELPSVARPVGAFSVYRPPSHQALPGDQPRAWSRRRTAIAEHMIHSLGTAAHVAAATEIDMSRVLAAREDDRLVAERQAVKLTVTAYLVQALARALSEHPELNATVVGQSTVLRAEKNIGVAVDTEEGLVVPVIRHADELGILGIARNLGELSERARRGALSAEDLSGGTFTLSNPGKDGNLFGISIIRQPEVAILRSGQVVKRAVVRTVDGEDVIVIRPMMVATLSYDHRIIDGRVGNAFLHAFRLAMESASPSLATQRPGRRGA